MEQVVLPGKPRHHPRLDLTRVGGNHAVTRRRTQRSTDGVVPTGWQVLQVQLVPATEPTGVRSIIVEHHGQRPTTGDFDEVLGAGLLDSRLDTKPCANHSLYPVIVVFQQVGHTLVRLGKSKRLLTGGKTYLGGWLNVEPAQHICKLIVGHQVFKADVHGVQQVLLALPYFRKMLLQECSVQLDPRFRIHTEGLVDGEQLGSRERLDHFAEQGTGQVHIVRAVLHVRSKLLLGEVFAAFTKCVLHLGSLDTNLVVFGKVLERATDTSAMQCTSHAECIQPQFRTDAEVP